MLSEIGDEKLEPDTEYEFQVRGENGHDDKYGPYSHTECNTTGNQDLKETHMICMMYVCVRDQGGIEGDYVIVCVSV